MQRLVNRDEDLAARIERAVLDLETLGVRVVESAVVTETGLDAHLERLCQDVTALEQAHAELRDL